jgi:cytochrome c oxidase assembly factor CtaG
MNGFLRTRRAALFLAGLILLGVSAITPVPDLVGNYIFSARMVQHLLLQLVIPPLLLLSFPLSEMAEGSGNWLLKRAWLTWLLGLGGMWVWHEPMLCNAAIRSPALHVFQFVSLLLVGAAFWWPIAGPRAGQRLPPLLGIVYLFTACLGCTILGIIITFAPPGLYLAPALPGLINDWQFASPADQRVGGLLMWVPGCLIYICGILGLLARWYGMPEGARFSSGAAERSL